MLLFDPQASAFQRVKVAGQILHVSDPEYFVMDGDNGIRFIMKHPSNLEVGDTVEAVGFPELSRASPVFMSTNWEDPGAMTWSAAPFYTFTSGTMTYECTYNNTGSNMNATIHSGPSYQTDEICMGIGYYFPSTGPRFCFDSTSL